MIPMATGAAEKIDIKPMIAKNAAADELDSAQKNIKTMIGVI